MMYWLLKNVILNYCHRPNFHPINHHHNEFKNMFNDEVGTNSDFDENYFLNPLLPLKL